MKSKIFIFLVGGLLGFVAGAGAMLVAFPFLFMGEAGTETVAKEDAVAVLAESAFREGADGQDGAHWGRGGLKAHKGADGDILLELQSDFEVGPGPNFWIYVNTVADVDNEKDFLADGERIKLAKLKNFSGSQVYRISAEEYRRAKAITVWCESFRQYIASANV